MGCLKLTMERRREQLKPRLWIEAAGISKGVCKCCFTLQMMFLYQDWNWIIENYSYFLHSGFASSESQLWSVHLEWTPMNTYFTYSFWIYHAVFTAPLQASKERPPQELDAMERAGTWAVCAHLALIWHCSWWLELPWSPEGAWTSLPALTEMWMKAGFIQHCHEWQYCWSQVMGRAQDRHLHRESFTSLMRSVWWREWSCCCWTQRRSQILRQKSSCQMLSACTPRICPPWDHLQSLGGRLGVRWEVRRNYGFAAMWTNQPFFISHRVESRRRLLSPEQCDPQLCQFLCLSLRVRAVLSNSGYIGSVLFYLAYWSVIRSFQVKKYFGERSLHYVFKWHRNLAQKIW